MNKPTVSQADIAFLDGTSAYRASAKFRTFLFHDLGGISSSEKVKKVAGPYAAPLYFRCSSSSDVQERPSTSLRCGSRTTLAKTQQRQPGQ
jgi:hypothetical protein